MRASRNSGGSGSHWGLLILDLSVVSKERPTVVAECRSSHHVWGGNGALCTGWFGLREEVLVTGAHRRQSRDAAGSNFRFSLSQNLMDDTLCHTGNCIVAAWWGPRADT